MELRFQPALLQEVIDSFVEKTEREGDPTYYKEFPRAGGSDLREIHARRSGKRV